MGRAIIIKDGQIFRKQPKCANCKGPHVASYKGCPGYNKQALRRVVDSRMSLNCTPKLISPPQPQNNAFTFSAEQLIKIVSNLAIQVAHPHVFYHFANPNQDTIDKKSSLCRRVSEAAKNNIGGSDITGISLFDAIGQLRPSALLAFKPKLLLPKVKPHSNSHHPLKSSNHQPYLNSQLPPAKLTMLSKNNQPKPSK